MRDWRFFYGDGQHHDDVNIENLPKSPPWRQFQFTKLVEEMNEEEKKRENRQQEEIEERWKKLQKLAESFENLRWKKKGESFRIYTSQENSTEEVTSDGKAVIDAVNAALYLRRPLLVTGNPGSGKTSLAYAIAHELKLGPVLTWSITSRSTLQDGLYRYDAIGRLQDKNEEKGIDLNIGDYLKLGPVGTAFLPSKFPRVLLIDEIDKSDIDLPNDLLHIFENGAFDITELIRRATDSQTNDGNEDSNRVEVFTEDSGIKASIYRGQVRCSKFPVVVMTSNGEREFPPAFLRRCLRVKMPDPNQEALKTIVKAHFGEIEFKKNQDKIEELIKHFLGLEKQDRESEFNDVSSESNRATDQLLNTIYLLTNDLRPKSSDEQNLKALLLKSLSTEEEL